MDVGSRSEEGVSRDGRYDFDRLEQSIGFLLKEHERLSAEREALLGELVDREHRIATLESRLDAEQDRRRVAVEGVDRIMARLGRLQADATAATKAAS